MENNSVLVAIPALNEEATIGKVIDEVQSEYPSIKILVVNDGSSDRTSEIARKSGASVLEIPFNVGVGGAMRAAFQYGLENHFDFVLQFDGDGQHDFRSIDALVSNAESADIIIGSRFNAMSQFEMGIVRRFAVQFLKVLVRSSTNTRVSDPTSGFRLANRKAMNLFVHEYPTSYLGDTVGSLILAGQNHLKIAEVDVNMYERKGGTASQSWIKLPIHLLRVGLMGLLFLLKKNPQRKEDI